MTDPGRFDRLEELFHELSELEGEERQMRLQHLQREDQDLHDHVVLLLARDTRGTERALLESVRSARELGPGDRLGPYRLVRQIGEGGMGVVFEAEQEEPLRRRVALKLVRAGLDSERVLARFEAERATLARMAHPAIAQVHDAGTSPDGRPYFVMELVEGQPIHDFCDQRRLTTRERIELFREVCEAVQHAHQKGILHRDLKPANILVSSPAGEARVKVIDFGIAKPSESDDGLGLTRLGEIVGTPEYMSPEQTRGGDVDTRSDVYSLGVVLYELITGNVPIEREALHGVSPVEVARVVDERAPTPPDSQLAPGTAGAAEVASLRNSDPGRLRRELRGDLGAILMMALRKEPERRYGAVHQFSADLGSYLAGWPVTARPDSLGYRVSKVVQRHTGAFVASLFLLLGLTAAAFFSTGMYFRAEAARGESEKQRVAAEEINRFLKRMLSSIDPELARGRDVSVLREVLDDAAAEIESELGGLPRVAADLELTIGSAYWSIGAEEEAERHLRSSLVLQADLDPLDAAAVADVELALGAVLKDRGEHEEAEDLLRSAVAERRERHPRDLSELAASLSSLGDLLEEIGEYAEAEEVFREAVEAAREGAAVDVLVVVLRGFGEHLMNHHRLDEAGPLLQEAVAVRREAGEESASLVLPLLTLGRWYRWSQRYEEAVEPVREAVQLARRDLVEAHPLRLSAIAGLANLEQHRGNAEEAERLYREALSAQRKIRGEDHSSVATTANNLGSLLREVGRSEEAAVLFAEATAGYVGSLGPDHYWTSIARSNWGRALLEVGRVEEAEKELVEARRVRVLEEAEGWQLAEVDVLLAACRADRDPPEQLAELLEQSLEELRARFGEDSPRLEAPTRLLEELRRKLRARKAAD